LLYTAVTQGQPMGRIRETAQKRQHRRQQLNGHGIAKLTTPRRKKSSVENITLK
jgi:hypothetical protein